jgi:hypothetical protein
LRGTLDAEGGALLAKALDEIGDELYRATRGDADVPRISAARRRADALVECARRASGVDIERTTPAKPSMSIVVPWSLLVDDDPDDPGAAPGDDRSPGAIVLRHVAAQRGDPVASDFTADALRRLACDANISRIVTGPGGEVLDVGRATRTVSDPQRRALVVRDKGCVFPGCDRPPGWCQSHHIVHWTNDGPTDLANLALVCHHHHHAVHDRGFTMTRGPDGTLTFTRPDGTLIA